MYLAFCCGQSGHSREATAQTYRRAGYLVTFPHLMEIKYRTPKVKEGEIYKAHS